MNHKLIKQIFFSTNAPISQHRALTALDGGYVACSDDQLVVFTAKGLISCNEEFFRLPNGRNCYSVIIYILSRVLSCSDLKNFPFIINMTIVVH